QQSLSTTNGLRASLQSLAAEAERLVAMGEVEVITDDPRPHVLLEPTRDAEAVGAMLRREIVGHEEINRLRFGLYAAHTRDDPGHTRGDGGTDAIALADQSRRHARM